MKKARLFRNGQSQAVRLPKEFRMRGSEVYIKQFGNAVVLIPKDNPWQSLIEGVKKFSSDYLSSRKQPSIQKRKIKI
ncbi:MAG: virulence factor [Deltaproteobacteria bacterium RIFCSPHIGHO2_12_FULL_43_9]|nr:MAG: virulence factor [Deltaproteobacteria bacterium RIFCSPHIGHO2_12_FULL_43_9]